MSEIHTYVHTGRHICMYCMHLYVSFATPGYNYYIYVTQLQYMYMVSTYVQWNLSITNLCNKDTILCPGVVQQCIKGL